MVLLSLRGVPFGTASLQELIGLLSAFIQVLRDQASNQERLSGYQVPFIHDGKGPPSYDITRAQLELLVGSGFTSRQIAEILGVSQSTVRRRLRIFHLNRSRRYAQITDQELDSMVTDAVGQNDLIGPESVRAQLSSADVLVQRRRVRASMLRTNPDAAVLRATSQRLQRRTYRVAGPNSLWHLDGYHKLIRWRIVIHGSIDGYSRLVVFLVASNNNRSSTVLQHFSTAVTQYGVPSQVRCDYGGENVDVCLFMNVFHGMGTRSVLRGQSTDNQRIERFWGDLWSGMINVYHSLFTFLESEGIIDPANELHMWALQYVYLPRINRDLRIFRCRWNNHGLRTEGFSTPVQLFVRACLRLQNRPLRAIQDVFEGPVNAPQLQGDVLPQGPEPAMAQEMDTPEYHNADPLWREDINVPESLFNLNEGCENSEMRQIQDLQEEKEEAQPRRAYDKGTLGIH
uniref:Integrase catalytic domain-containing protein n=2 Tax=Cyprinus carpio carpio TaxID=630221 RepID=A0A9J7XB17_CYPCA